MDRKIIGTLLWPWHLPCLFHALTGFYCPGCGGTRAVKALFHGRLLLCLLYHPLVFYCAALAVWFAVSYALYRLTGDKGYRRSLENRYVNIGVVLILLNFLVKNMLLAVCGIDLLAMLPQP